MYWIFANELVDEDRDSDITGTLSVDLGGELSFDDGEAISVPVPKIVMTMAPGSRAGHMTDHLSIPETTGLVFSSKLRELMRAMRVDSVQYFDFEVRGLEEGIRYVDYKIANVVGHVDCVDKDRSDLRLWDNGDIKRIRRLILDESRIPPELRVFRLSNRRILTVVHDSIRRAVMRAGITGCVFYRPEDYR